MASLPVRKPISNQDKKSILLQCSTERYARVLDSSILHDMSAIRDTLNLDNGKALRYYTLAFIQIRYINLTCIFIVTTSDSF